MQLATFALCKSPAQSIYRPLPQPRKSRSYWGIVCRQVLPTMHLAHKDTIVNESRSLVLGPTDEEPLAQFIMRVAFSDPSDASNPVLQSVFAIASLQLHGSMKSFRYKHSVINSVKESINSQDERRLLQNLMATMLLYHYEVACTHRVRSS